MNEEHTVFTITNIGIGIFIGLILFNFFPGTLLKSSRTAIEECEQALPRNQHCIIKAIPEEK